MKILAGYEINNRKNPTFEGINIKRLFIKSTNPLKKNQSIVDRIISLTDLESEQIFPIVKKSCKRKQQFIQALAEKYNQINHYLNGNLREKPENILNVLQIVTNPNERHFKILNRYDEKIEFFQKLFSNARNKKSLDFAINFRRNVFEGENYNHNILIDLLNSPNKEQYIRNIDDYKSYLMLNSNNPKAVKELDVLVQNGIYSRKNFDRKLDIEYLLKENNSSKLKTINKNELLKYYSKEGVKFLNIFYQKMINRFSKDISYEDQSKILDLYKSTTPKNIDLRTSVLEKFNIKTDNISEQLDNLKTLFERTDSDENLMEFVNKLLGNVKIETIKEFNRVLDAVPPQKAKIFYKNIINILNKTNDNKKRLQALQNEITNPFYESYYSGINRKSMEDYGFIERESRFSKLKKRIENKFNKFRYSLTKEGKSIENIEVKPVETIAEKSAEKTEEISTIANPKVIVSPYKERKLKLINDIKGIITKKLGTKTLSLQEVEYTKNATKMRLNLLPEIFESVKETRQTDRMAGKLKSNSANKNVIELYKKINGTNKKYIKYLLTKRNVDGSRMFEISDIIRIIEKAENRIQKLKQENPNMNSKDIKAYYEHLYQLKLEQYGKVNKTKSLKQ